MSLIVSRSPPCLGSVSSSKERRCMSIRWGTSSGFLSLEKLLRVTGAALERAKSATPQAVRGTWIQRRYEQGDPKARDHGNYHKDLLGSRKAVKTKQFGGCREAGEG